MNVLCIWGSGGQLPQGNFDFRCSETISSAFSGMMNSIWEKLHYDIFTEQYTTHSDL